MYWLAKLLKCTDLSSSLQDAKTKMGWTCRFIQLHTFDIYKNKRSVTVQSQEKVKKQTWLQILLHLNRKFKKRKSKENAKLENICVTEIQHSISDRTAAAGTLACLPASQYGSHFLRRSAVRQLLIQRRVSVALREPLLHYGRLSQEVSPINPSLCSLFQ